MNRFIDNNNSNNNDDNNDNNWEGRNRPQQEGQPASTQLTRDASAHIHHTASSKPGPKRKGWLACYTPVGTPECDDGSNAMDVPWSEAELNRHLNRPPALFLVEKGTNNYVHDSLTKKHLRCIIDGHKLLYHNVKMKDHLKSHINQLDYILSHRKENLVQTWNYLDQDVKAINDAPADFGEHLAKRQKILENNDNMSDLYKSYIKMENLAALPKSFRKNKGFRAFCDTLIMCTLKGLTRPGLVLGDSMYSNNVDDMVESIKQQLYREIVSSGYFSIQFDGWTNGKKHIIGIIAVVNLTPYLLGWFEDKSRGSVELAKSVSRILNEFFSDQAPQGQVSCNQPSQSTSVLGRQPATAATNPSPRLASIVTDGANVMTNARHDLFGSYHCAYETRCFSHLFNLIAKNLLSSKMLSRYNSALVAVAKAISGNEKVYKTWQANVGGAIDIPCGIRWCSHSKLYNQIVPSMKGLAEMKGAILHAHSNDLKLKTHLELVTAKESQPIYDALQRILALLAHCTTVTESDCCTLPDLAVILVRLEFTLNHLSVCGVDESMQRVARLALDILRWRINNKDGGRDASSIVVKAILAHTLSFYGKHTVRTDPYTVPELRELHGVGSSSSTVGLSSPVTHELLSKCALLIWENMAEPGQYTWSQLGTKLSEYQKDVESLIPGLHGESVYMEYKSVLDGNGLFQDALGDPNPIAIIAAAICHAPVSSAAVERLLSDARHMCAEWKARLSEKSTRDGLTIRQYIKQQSANRDDRTYGKHYMYILGAKVRISRANEPAVVQQEPTQQQLISSSPFLGNTFTSQCEQADEQTQRTAEVESAQRETLSTGSELLGWAQMSKGSQEDASGSQQILRFEDRDLKPTLFTWYFDMRKLNLLVDGCCSCPEHSIGFEYESN